MLAIKEVLKEELVPVSWLATNVPGLDEDAATRFLGENEFSSDSGANF